MIFNIVGKGGGTTIVQTPTVNVGTYYYTGSAQGPTVTRDTTNTIISNATQIEPGTYTLTIALANIHKMVWSDMTTADKTYTYTIKKASITVPTVTVGSYIYNGNNQGPTISGDTSLLTVTNAKATEPGTYILTMAITDSTHYIWSDSTTANKTWSYTINKIQGTISLSTVAMSLSSFSLYADTTATYNGDGTLTCSSGNASIATVALNSGTTYRVTAVASGSTTVTISAAATSHYSAASATVTVSCSLVSATLNDNSWATISSISDAGTASAYWSVGDTKSITLNGSVGAGLTLSNETVWVYIIGFDHNSSIEGTGISFGSFKTAQTGGNDMALIDSKYSTSITSGKYFSYNHNAKTNSGGWKGSDIRYDILGSTDVPASNYGRTTYSTNDGYDATSSCATSPVSNTLMAALPSDLRAVMKPITKYTNNYGPNKYSTGVTASVDYLPLMAECEAYGSSISIKANPYEKDYQAQYQYYANGNSVVKYQFTDLSSYATQISRSPYTNNTDAIYVNLDGFSTNTDANKAFAIAPVFLV